MAGKCVFCGTSFNLFNNGIGGFDDEKNRKFCNKCCDVFVSQISPKVAEGIRSNIPKSKVLQSIVEDHDLSEEGKEYVKDYIDCFIEKETIKVENEKENEIQAQRTKEIEEKFLEYKKQFKVTTGYNFDGYEVEKYIGIFSGEVVLGTGFISEYAASFSDLFGTRSNAFADKMMTAKQGALQKLMKNALLAGANALIGVDFDYITFSNNILGVSANGTAVVIRKEEK